MKVTIRAAAYGKRPAAPVCPAGDSINCWAAAPDDAPWWYTSEWNGGKWGGVEEFGALLDKDDQTLCESGYCYFIDFHFDLGGVTELTRTTLGNPPNDVS